MPNDKLPAETAHATFAGWPCESIIVENASELPKAIKIGRTVELEDPLMGSRFAAVQAWQETQYWLLSPLVVALLSFAIAQRYGIERSWHRNWKIRRVGGRVILNPVERSARR
jgi:hypothetical protein